MAEGWTRHLHGKAFEVASAGTEPHGMNPLAVRAMAEVGVDIASQHSKSVADLPSLDFDLVITVCDSAAEHCPLFPGRARVEHHGFDDPPRLAAAATSDAEAMAPYRRVRDEIAELVRRLPEMIGR